MLLRILLLFFFSSSFIPHASFAEEEEEKSNTSNTKHKTTKGFFGVKILGSSYSIGPREELNLLIVTGGRIQIYGKLNKLVVFDGEIILHEGSSIKNSVTLLGGKLEKEEGAFIPKGAVKYDTDGDVFLSFLNIGKSLYKYLYEKDFNFIYQLIYYLLLAFLAKFFIPQFIFNASENLRKKSVLCTFLSFNVFLFFIIFFCFLFILFLVLSAPFIIFILIPFAAFCAFLSYFLLFPMAAVVLARFLSTLIARLMKKPSMEASLLFLSMGILLFLVFLHLGGLVAYFFIRFVQFIALGAIFLQMYYYAFQKNKIHKIPHSK